MEEWTDGVGFPLANSPRVGRPARAEPTHRDGAGDVTQVALREAMAARRAAAQSRDEAERILSAADLQAAEIVQDARVRAATWCIGIALMGAVNAAALCAVLAWAWRVVPR